MTNASSRPATRKPRLCLVDDDELMRALFTRVLQRTGCDVITAGGPEEAIDTLRAHSVDVVITDLRMPDIADGMRLLEQLRHDAPGRPTWVMSSEFGQSLQMQLLAAGVTQCIEKPFSADLISQLVDKLELPELHRQPPAGFGNR